jgi:hypothetical protein
MNKPVLLVGIIILGITGCAVPPIDRLNSVYGTLSNGVSPMCTSGYTREWVEYIPQNQSFWSRWHYTYHCLLNYSEGKGWNNLISNQ